MRYSARQREENRKKTERRDENLTKVNKANKVKLLLQRRRRRHYGVAYSLWHTGPHSATLEILKNKTKIVQNKIKLLSLLVFVESFALLLFLFRQRFLFAGNREKIILMTALNSQLMSL